MLGIIIINFRMEELTIRFVREELSKVSTPHVVVIVNNGATDESDKYLCEKLNAPLIHHVDERIDGDGSIYLISSSDNLGFARGNNLAALFCRNHFHTEYLLFTNNDIQLKTNNVIEVLCQTLASHPEAGAAGPEVLGLDGCRQSPNEYLGMWDRYVWMYLSTPFISKTAKRSIFYLDYPARAQEGPCYMLSGSFLMVHSDAFFSAGMFDDGTFLYAEENILSDRLKQIGKVCWFVPGVSVLHNHSQTVSTYHGARARTWMQWKSMRYYYRRYRGASIIECAMVGFIFWLILLIKK